MKFLLSKIKCLLKEGMKLSPSKIGHNLAGKDDRETRYVNEKKIVQDGGGVDDVNEDHHCDRRLWATTVVVPVGTADLPELTRARPWTAVGFSFFFFVFSLSISP